jgi:hypothetical protein
MEGTDKQADGGIEVEAGLEMAGFRPTTRPASRPAPPRASLADTRGTRRGPAGVRRRMRQVAQAVPLTVKLVGTASLVVQVPWKPMEVLAPAAIVEL